MDEDNVLHHMVIFIKFHNRLNNVQMECAIKTQITDYLKNV